MISVNKVEMKATLTEIQHYSTVAIASGCLGLIQHYFTVAIASGCLGLCNCNSANLIGFTTKLNGLNIVKVQTMQWQVK